MHVLHRVIIASDDALPILICKYVSSSRRVNVDVFHSMHLTMASIRQRRKLYLTHSHKVIGSLDKLPMDLKLFWPVFECI